MNNPAAVGDLPPGETRVHSYKRSIVHFGGLDGVLINFMVNLVDD